MVMEAVNAMIDAMFMSFASEFVGFSLMCIKVFGAGYLLYNLAKIVFTRKK